MIAIDALFLGMDDEKGPILENQHLNVEVEHTDSKDPRIRFFVGIDGNEFGAY